MNLTTCMCESLPEPMGFLIDYSVTPYANLTRVNLGEEFTIREWAIEGQAGEFEWAMEGEPKCFMPTFQYADPEGRFMQVSLNASVPDCEDNFFRYQKHTNKTVNFTVTMKVWPEREAPVNGDLFDLDVNTSRALNLVGQQNLTVRVDERATETGFAWHAPVHNYSCMELVETNYGNFTTGYYQYLFHVNDSDCQEVIPLVHTEHSATPGMVEDLVISVTKKPCDLMDCPAGEIQDLYTCGCVSMPPVFGNLTDISYVNTTEQYFMSNGSEFTLIDWANQSSTGEYDWEWPTNWTNVSINCLEVFEPFQDPWNRFRQASFRAVQDDCRVMLEISALKVAEIAVWPEREPEHLGTLINLDNVNESMAIFGNLTGGDVITIRMVENATSMGWQYYEPSTLQSECSILFSENYGEFNVGYKQYVYNVTDLNCSEVITLERRTD